MLVASTGRIHPGYSLTPARAGAALPELSGGLSDQVMLQAVPLDSLRGLAPERVRGGDLENVQLRLLDDLLGGINLDREVRGGAQEWTEVRKHGRTFKVRRYHENGQDWEETIEGNNRWRVPQGGEEGLKARARLKPPQIVSVAGPGGPLEVKVYGEVNETQIKTLKRVLEQAPPGARIYAQEIYVAADLGHGISPDGSKGGDITGLAGGESDNQPRFCGMILHSKLFDDEKELRATVFHEMGHNADYSRGNLSSRPPWGQGPSAPDPRGDDSYGRTNALEDFAEVHRYALENAQRYAHLSEAEILMQEPKIGHKLVKILRMYGLLKR